MRVRFASPTLTVPAQVKGDMSAPPVSAAGILSGVRATYVQAASLAAIDSIGYANKPGKHATLTSAGATAIVSSLAELVLPLRARMHTDQGGSQVTQTGAARSPFSASDYPARGQ